MKVRRRWAPSCAGSVFHSLRMVVIIGVGRIGGKGNFHVLITASRGSAARRCAEGALPIANGRLPIGRWPAPGRRMIPPQDIAARGFLRVWTGKNNSILTDI